MKAVSFGVFVVIAVVAGAPTIHNSIPNYYERQLLDQLRYKRKIAHGYGVGMPLSVGTLGLSHLNSYIPYQWNMRPYMNPYGYSSGYQSVYGCGRGLLRSEDQNGEEEHSTRQTDANTPANLVAGQLVSPPGGPAYGLFPNVPSSDCNIPLLFSCEPSIVPAKMARGYGMPSFNFRDVDYGIEPQMQEQVVHENSAMGDASHVVKD